MRTSRSKTIHQHPQLKPPNQEPMRNVGGMQAADNGFCSYHTSWVIHVRRVCSFKVFNWTGPGPLKTKRKCMLLAGVTQHDL